MTFIFSLKKHILKSEYDKNSTLNSTLFYMKHFFFQLIRLKEIQTFLTSAIVAFLSIN